MAVFDNDPVQAEQVPRLQDTDVESGLENENELRNSQIRNAIIRKVYMVLLLQMMFTAGLMALFMTVDALKSFAFNYYWVIWVVYITGWILIILMSPKLKWVQSNSLGYVICAASTIMFSTTIAAVSSMITRYQAVSIVINAALITDGIGLVVTILAFQTWTKIPEKGKLLMLLVEVILLLVAICICIAIFVISDSEPSNKKLMLASSFLLVIMYTCLLFSDTQLLVEGNFTTSLISPKESIYRVIFILKFL